MARSSYSDTTRCWGTRDTSWRLGVRGRNRGMEKGGERGEQISLATIMKHHLITGLIMEWNSRTILFDFCPVNGASVLILFEGLILALFSRCEKFQRFDFLVFTNSTLEPLRFSRLFPKEFCINPDSIG